MMEVIEELPPNIEAILKVFPKATQAGVIFAFGNVIYNPSGATISTELYAHEAVHQQRQLAHGVTQWWERYLAEKQFCFAEELLAHQAEFQKFCENHSQGRARFLNYIAKRLSGSLYGHQVTFDKAKYLIKWKKDAPIV